MDKKKIFISWSGSVSHQMALILREWLPSLFAGIETWVSSEDIQKGTRWSTELAKQLNETSFGIICLDPSNIYSPWINFEAGALSKYISHSKIFPILYRLSPTDLNGPLAQFQITVFEKQDILKLVKSINMELGDTKLDNSILEKSFSKLWTKLEKPLKKIKVSEKNNRASTISKNESGLTETEIRILKEYDVPDLYISNKNFVDFLNINELKLEYYLNKLKDQKYIDQASDGDWFILEKGIDFLVNSGEV